MIGIREPSSTSDSQRTADLHTAALRAYCAIHKPPQQIIGTVGQDQGVHQGRQSVAVAGSSDLSGGNAVLRAPKGQSPNSAGGERSGRTVIIAPALAVVDDPARSAWLWTAAWSW